MFVTVLLYQLKMISSDTYSVWVIISLNILILQYSNNLFIYVWRKDENWSAIMDIVSLVYPKCITKTQKKNMNERVNEINQYGIKTPIEESHQHNKVQATEYISEIIIENAEGTFDSVSADVSQMNESII